MAHFRSLGRALLIAALLLGHSAGSALASEGAPLHVFAAASLATVLPKLGDDFERQYGQTVRLSYGSSSTLSRQISQGAPAQVFISANPRWMQTLIDAQLVEPHNSRGLLRNTLVLVAPSSSSLPALEAPPSTEQLQAWLAHGRLAVGDPQHVPVGIYAKQALDALALWQSVEHRLAPTEDARASLALLQRAEVELGIVYHSDLIGLDQLKKIADIPLPKGQTIEYPVAIIGPDKSGQARAFVQFLGQPAAQRYFNQMGFSTDKS